LLESDSITVKVAVLGLLGAIAGALAGIPLGPGGIAGGAAFGWVTGMGGGFVAGKYDEKSDN